MDGAAGRIRVAGLAGSFVCLVGALLAGNAFLESRMLRWEPAHLRNRNKEAAA